MTCQWQLGLLLMRPCGQPAAAACALCKRMICDEHAVPGPQGMACPQCASRSDEYEVDDDSVDVADTRDEYIQRYGASTGYGSQGYFTPADSAALGSLAGGAQRKPQKTYDPRES